MTASQNLADHQTGFPVQHLEMDSAPEFLQLVAHLHFLPLGFLIKNFLHASASLKVWAQLRERSYESAVRQQFLLVKICENASYLQNVQSHYLFLDLCQATNQHSLDVHWLLADKLNPGACPSGNIARLGLPPWLKQSFDQDHLARKRKETLEIRFWSERCARKISHSTCLAADYSSVPPAWLVAAPLLGCQKERPSFELQQNGQTMCWNLGLRGSTTEHNHNLHGKWTQTSFLHIFPYHSKSNPGISE
mmetsp:Transcript_163605/g.298486  ORF Transcript_163605/g.298486 Transcript_163605/m.298486 type:complete len:249 (-) Transcript_163605:1197-1943(-)